MADYYVYGKNAVRECIRSRDSKHVYARKRLENDPLVKLASDFGVPVSYVEDRELDKLAGNGHHQGIVAQAKLPELVPLRRLIEIGKEKGRYPLVLILDGLEDPANLGAILRSCDAFGVDGVIIRNKGNVPLNSTVAKVSTGAVHHVPVCGVGNLSQAISELKDAGYWIVSSDGEAKLELDQVDYKCPIALIVGSEGFGVSNLVLKRSDFIVKIPMVGHVNSLNASVATGILVSHIFLSRK
ncbi:MAG: 23S rRNA (guanosine(2251)-2'-O)-methyltransferase RlmB [Bacilli bacterium]|nr:23S rRNA (guanosine(2251)-2'-O)-methyltransferase RlmB [Bacilli bacterium]